MSGFQVPAKAIEAAADVLLDEERGDFGAAVSRRRLAEEILSAALPVLAEDPDAIKRVAHALRTNASIPYAELGPETQAWLERWAGDILAALFGVASPSNKETT